MWSSFHTCPVIWFVCGFGALCLHLVQRVFYLGESSGGIYRKERRLHTSGLRMQPCYFPRLREHVMVLKPGPCKLILWVQVWKGHMEKEICLSRGPGRSLRPPPPNQSNQSLDKVQASHLRPLPIVFEGTPAAAGWTRSLYGGRRVLFPLRRRTFGCSATFPLWS